MKPALRTLAIVGMVLVSVAPGAADDCSMALDIRDDRSVVVRTVPDRSEIEVSKQLSPTQSSGLKYSVARKDGKKSLRASLPGFPAPGTPRRAMLMIGASAVPDIPVSDLKPTLETTAQEEFEGVDLTTLSAPLSEAWKEGKDARLVILAGDQPAVDLFFDGRVYKRAMAEMQSEMDTVFPNAAAGKCASAPAPGGGGGGPIL